MPTAADWIETWERGRLLRPLLRPIALLARADPDAGEDVLLALPLGERDRRLLALRASLFGRTVECTAACPACAERVEISFPLDLLTPAGPPSPERPVIVEEDGHRIVCRLLDSRDLDAASREADLEAATARLLERSVVAAERDSENVSPAALSTQARAAVDRTLAARDPLAAVTLDVRCPRCGHAWTPLFDVAAHLWDELERWVAQLLREVHVLASAYGWREQDILAMSALRRARYLQLAEGAIA